MHLTNGYISIMHAAYAQAFFLFRDVYTLVKASSPISVSTGAHQDFGSWTDRVLRMDRWIDCSFRVTQLSAVRLFGALSSRVDLQNFNVHRSPISFSLFLLRRYVYICIYTPFSLSFSLSLLRGACRFIGKSYARVYRLFRVLTVS